MRRVHLICLNCIFVFAAIFLLFGVGIANAQPSLTNYFTGIALTGNATYTIQLTGEATVTTSLVIQFVSTNGTAAYTHADSIGIGATEVYTINDLPIAPGFIGSAIVSSDQPLSAEMTLNTGSNSVTLPAMTQGESQLNLIGVRRNSGEASTLAVMNTSSSPVTVLIEYGGTICSESATVAAGGAYVSSVLFVGCLPDDYSGAATISVPPSRANELVASIATFTLPGLQIVDASNGVTTPLAVTVSHQDTAQWPTVSIALLLFTISALSVGAWLKQR